MRSAATYRLASVVRAALWLSALGLGVIACQRSADNADTCAPCGNAFSADPARQAQIAAQWRSVAQRLGHEEALDFRCLCFGVGASTSVEGQDIYLPADWELREQTARAVHLASHRSLPPWSAQADSTCEARVERALTREADAHALELETRRALSVTTARYSFEADYFATPPDQRRAWLRTYFVAHPGGDGVVPGFLASYRARCQERP